MRMILFGLTVLCALQLVSCSHKDDDVQASAPTPSPPADPQWAAISQLIAKNCGTCHNGTVEPAFATGAVFKASAARAKLQSGEMPPAPRKISDEDKAALLAYLGV